MVAKDPNILLFFTWLLHGVAEEVVVFWRVGFNCVAHRFHIDRAIDSWSAPKVLTLSPPTQIVLESRVVLRGGTLGT